MRAIAHNRRPQKIRYRCRHHKIRHRCRRHDRTISDMSPTSTFNNCGSSSSRYSRNRALTHDRTAPTIAARLAIAAAHKHCLSTKDSHRTALNFNGIPNHAGQPRSRVRFRPVGFFIVPIHRNVKPSTLKGPSKSCNHLEATNGFSQCLFHPVRIRPVTGPYPSCR